MNLTPESEIDRFRAWSPLSGGTQFPPAPSWLLCTNHAPVSVTVRIAGGVALPSGTVIGGADDATAFIAHADDATNGADRARGILLHAVPGTNGDHDALALMVTPLQPSGGVELDHRPPRSLPLIVVEGAGLNGGAGVSRLTRLDLGVAGIRVV